jgi:phosphatidylserine/phosphatidylglycerophosphate/cardiolipin synthase-like enzyme
MNKHILRSLVLGIAMILCASGIIQAQCTVEPYFSPYDNVEKVVVKRLSDAKDSIKCSLYGITNRQITDTLTKKVSDGVKVILCLDKTQSAGKSSTHKELEQAGVEIVIKKTGVLEHNKFCVIDNKRVVMGSWNYSANAQKQDNSMVDLSGCDGIIKSFTDAFERIYQRDK